MTGRRPRPHHPRAVNMSDSKEKDWEEETDGEEDEEYSDDNDEVEGGGGFTRSLVLQQNKKKKRSGGFQSMGMYMYDVHHHFIIYL